jgi:hypothetical protein
MTFAEHLRHGGQPGLDSLHRAGARRRVPHHGDAAILQLGGAQEQHLALVREVAEEGALGQAGRLGDLRDCRRLVATLVKQRHCRLDQAAGGIRFPT